MQGIQRLLTPSRSRTPRYQALNELALRGLWLALEAWRDDPPEFFLLENVPLLRMRGRHLLDQISCMLRAYGYAVAETMHDCGELGGLAQSRKRFLLVARHAEKVPPLLYVPSRKPLRSVGSLLDKMPLPGEARGGPMHRVPSLTFKTWTRLAFVTAGSDWRSLRRLAVQDGWLRDYGIAVDVHNTGSGVHRRSATAGNPCPSAAFRVADPRFFRSQRWNAGQQYGVCRWTDTVGTITGQQTPGQGRFAVADPRPCGMRHDNVFRVVRRQDTSLAATGVRARAPSARAQLLSLTRARSPAGQCWRGCPGRRRSAVPG